VKGKCNAVIGRKFRANEEMEILLKLLMEIWEYSGLKYDFVSCS